MREDSPAARITPAKPATDDMLRKIAESREKVSDGELLIVRPLGKEAFNQQSTIKNPQFENCPGLARLVFIQRFYRTGGFEPTHVRQR